VQCAPAAVAHRAAHLSNFAKRVLRIWMINFRRSIHPLVPEVVSVLRLPLRSTRLTYGGAMWLVDGHFWWKLCRGGLVRWRKVATDTVISGVNRVNVLEALSWWSGTVEKSCDRHRNLWSEPCECA
jgi:hypothetical protein